MAVNIKCLLGKVSSEDAEVDTSQAKPNSTKWIFDVLQNGTQQAFGFQLLDSNTGKVKESSSLSFSFTPLNKAAATAALWVSHPNTPSLGIEADENQEALQYRVTIDAVHSMNR